jgi:hypothetical protein
MLLFIWEAHAHTLIKIEYPYQTSPSHVFIVNVSLGSLCSPYFDCAISKGKETIILPFGYGARLYVTCSEVCMIACVIAQLLG